MKKSSESSLFDKVTGASNPSSNRENNRNPVYFHIVNGESLRRKDEFPFAVALSINLEETKLHEDLRKYLAKEQARGHLSLDSINKTPLRVSYAIDFQSEELVIKLVKTVFKGKKLSKFGVFKN